MNDRSFRPAIADQGANIAACDTILLGFPIWWGVAPTVVNTFLEAYDFSGKKIVLFATSGGSGFGPTARELKKSVAADVTVAEGRMLNRPISPLELKKWIDICAKKP